MNSRRPKRGFSLAEVLFTVCIVALGLMLFAAAFPAANKGVLRSEHMEIATQRASQVLEGWRQVGYSSLPAIPAGATSVTQTIAVGGDLPNAQGTVTFTNVDAALGASTSATGRRRVDVTISWQGTPSDAGSVTLTTLITNQG